MFKYLLAQAMEQNLLVPLNWLAGAKFLQYSHFSTEGREERETEQVVTIAAAIGLQTEDRVTTGE